MRWADGLTSSAHLLTTTTTAHLVPSSSAASMRPSTPGTCCPAASCCRAEARPARKCVVSSLRAASALHVVVLMRMCVLLACFFSNQQHNANLFL
jgi:hypothetical protein